MLLYLTTLFLFGSAFGSFGTVLISRWKNHTGGIIFGRSFCPGCKHTLTWKELFPILSYMAQRGKCRNCKTSIPVFYPASEILMGAVFSLLGYMNIVFGFALFSPQLILLCILGFITVIYILYDIRYTEIPDQVMLPGIVGYFILLVLGYFVLPVREILFDAWSYRDYVGLVNDHISAAIILYSFFYLQIFIPGTFYFLKKKEYGKIGELFVTYFIFPFAIVWEYILRKGIKEDTGTEEIPAWVGGGDLRVAIFIGLTLGLQHGISALFTAYILGSIVGIILLAKGNIKNHKIPFGPFLGFGWIFVLVFYIPILNII